MASANLDDEIVYKGAFTSNNYFTKKRLVFLNTSTYEKNI